MWSRLWPFQSLVLELFPKIVVDHAKCVADVGLVKVNPIYTGLAFVIIVPDHCEGSEVDSNEV